MKVLNYSLITKRIFCIILLRVLLTIDGVLDWMIWFIAPYTFTQFETTGNTALLLFYTLSVHRCTRVMILSPHYSYHGNGFITLSLWLQLTHEVLLAQSNSFLGISSQSPWAAISRSRPNSIPSRVLHFTSTLLYSVASSDCALL
jgi:hypothetical protein